MVALDSRSDVQASLETALTAARKRNAEAVRERVSLKITCIYCIADMIDYLKRNKG